MPTPFRTYQTLLTQYNQLPWYKKAGFWLSAPRLSWGLFGYKRNPDENRVKQLVQWAKASRFFKTKFEQDICNLVVPEVNKNSNYNTPPQNTKDAVALGGCRDVIDVIAERLSEKYHSASRVLYSRL